MWRQSEKYKVPKIAFVNKMDRIGANFYSVMDQMKNQLGANPVPVVLPIGAGETFDGIIDLIKMKAIRYDMKSLGKNMTEEEIPADMVEKAQEYRQKMIESAAEQDDALMEKFFAGEELTNDEIKMALRKGCMARTITPAFCGSAFKDKGVQQLLDGVCDYLPSPLDAGAAVSADDPSQKREPSDNEPSSAASCSTPRSTRSSASPVSSACTRTSRRRSRRRTPATSWRAWASRRPARATRSATPRSRASDHAGVHRLPGAGDLGRGEAAVASGQREAWRGAPRARDGRPHLRGDV